MSESDIVSFRSLLERAWPELSSSQLERVVQFYSLVVSENEKQNLTRLISPQDFLEGHVLDVRAVLRSGLVRFPAMDLGSGVGVPGLLAACLAENRWILAESEGRKAEFLRGAAKTLSLSNTEVFSGRAEDFLKKGRVETVVARAVGPINRIYAWLRPCSTWNSLVLLKGPGWNAEWKAFQESKQKSELKIEFEFNYSTGQPPKSLRIVRLNRVPRGTSRGATR